jgi:DNA-3-methyladenine glycosylase II
VLRPIIRQVGPCGLRKRGAPYAYLVRSVLYQQLAGSAARAIEGRFHASYGCRVPPPEILSRARADRLRRLGLSRQKAAAVKAIGQAFADGTVPARRLGSLPDEEVIALVTQIRGVGEWTAHMLLMSSLGRLDVLPVGDYGVRKAARDLYGLDDLPKPDELTALAEGWRPYRTRAATGCSVVDSLAQRPGARSSIPSRSDRVLGRRFPRAVIRCSVVDSLAQ